VFFKVLLVGFGLFRLDVVKALNIILFIKPLYIKFLYIKLLYAKPLYTKSLI
jgi:hypothetical protein